MKLGHVVATVALILVTLWAVNRVPAIGNIVK